MQREIKLRREFNGQDSWGMFIEEVAVIGGKLDYRATDGGNCEIGDYLDWEGEEEALKFLLGFMPSKGTILRLRREISNLPTLSDYEVEPEVNYHRY